MVKLSIGLIICCLWLPAGFYGDYNWVVKVVSLHSWQINVTQALQIQRSLSAKVLTEGELTEVNLVAGVDASVDQGRGTATAAAVVLQYPQLRVVEVRIATGRLSLPYIPGLLSFREAPLMLSAFEQLGITPDLILVDGQGIAHPRRLGLASHLGLFLDTPTIGCAKSRLCGRHEAPAEGVGSYAEIIDNGEVIGAVLRTKPRVKPIYVSVGHKISLTSAIRWVLRCTRGYRLPEPTRMAHLAAGGNLKLERDVITTTVDG
ncbi:MAG: deoxyribonuclease V [Dehalococcoidales bacterium]|nr:deoxyribonuclease V [Dehalococcoidales bacterium]